MTITLEGLELKAVRVALQDLRLDLMHPDYATEPDEQDRELMAAAAAVLAKILK